MSKMSDNLTAEEIVVNPSDRIDSTLLTLEDFSIELLRFRQIIGRDCMMEGFVSYCLLHLSDMYY